MAALCPGSLPAPADLRRSGGSLTLPQALHSAR